MAKKKTIQVELIKKIINRKLAVSSCNSDVRKGMVSVLEEILYHTENYNGYSYLKKGEVPEDQLPGIDKDSEGKNIFPDETRRYYF